MMVRGAVVMAAVLLSLVAEEPADLDRILEEARRAQGEDVAAWRNFRFRRHVTREKLDAEGETKRQEVLEFVISPQEEGFDEKLVLLDGEEPARSEVKGHRKKARFTKHYETARQGDGEEDADGGFTLHLLLELTSHRLEGRVVVDGIPCYRLTFSPPPEPTGEGLAARLTNAMEGTLWITQDGHHVYKASARTVQPVSFAWFFGKVSRLEVDMEAEPVGEGRWLPRQIQIRTEARFMGVPIRKRNTYRYSQYEPIP
jgi:hypothetical protein